MSEPPYRTLVEYTRGGIVESVHTGAIAVVDAQGRLVAAYGDPTAVTFLRSSAKPFQTLPLIESGAADVNRWVVEERNVYDDYKAAFGERPPSISGVAIMTDTDNTGESATAFYGDIVFKKSGALNGIPNCESNK